MSSFAVLGQFTIWLTPFWLIAVGVGLGTIVLGLSLGLLYLVSKRKALAALAAIREGILLPLTVVALVLTTAIGLGSIGWYIQTSSAELTDQEVYRIIKNWHDDNGHLFVSQEELTAQHEVINQAIAAPHIEIQDNEDKILLNRQSINDMKIELAKLKNQQSGTGLPSQGSISVSVSESCYEHGDVVTFEGMATPSRQLTSSIFKDKKDFEASPTTNTNSNGSFQLYWVIPDDIDIGTYNANLKDSGGKFGGTTVNVRNSC